MGNIEIPNWLDKLPLAPEFRPTETEFADPIAYISKIEKEASAFGICKIIPPLPKPSKKYVFGNLNKSLLKCPELGRASSKVGSSDNSDGEIRAVFTTRQQELGQTVKKSKLSSSGAHKQVWQSGEVYTLEQFESKSRVFAKSQLGAIKDVSPLVIETMFWKAALDKPIYLEYANDVPGSGFGEMDGQLRYFHRRRRKRAFFTRSREGSGCKANEMDSDKVDVSQNNDSNGYESCIEVPTQPAKEKKDGEGSAGWKISNSLWNLQVISRSPGSLTRFMPDDIPGVTSPMVYIGMLFSWFAWHVEDHELHSMNFLHTGASKTWYSVPGDYAFAFEEVVRSEAYGANIDRIAALALLGEKTTLMSPQVAVASGIPCCRLVQNPGEFVVTFPRAYHVGFSHGFNCGEAANFGTPQWLKVAKEAAVRRAAMSYLPMLSHQQLLYLLTMSFVSRVPRSFLPGVRSSRLRDRQKEEREFLVKKAFIEDILHENKVVSVLLGKDSGYRAIFWDQGLLAYPSKETVLPTVDTISTEKSSHMDTNKHDDERPCLLDEMSLYMENLNDSYLGSDDLSCDFQVDSGTLPCVACGILGFPFMSVVQPSEKASLLLRQDFPKTTEYSSEILGASNTRSFPEDTAIATPLDSITVANLPLPSISNSGNGWNVHNKFLRPRSFCLEHAVEIVELLESKGGARVLVICHSDYKKIKAHAITIAEEIGCPFYYTEVPLNTALKEDLQLIDLAIEDGEHNSRGEDWTSVLGINLRHCVKIRKNFASKQVQHALTLGGLLSDKYSTSDFSGIKWTMRRTRSKKIYLPVDIKPLEIAESKNDVLVEKVSSPVRKEIKLIQYTRRKFKTKKGGSATSLDSEQRKVAVNNKIWNAENSSSIDFSATQTESQRVEIHFSESEAHRLAVSVRSDEPVEEHFTESGMGILEEKMHIVEYIDETGESEGNTKDLGDERYAAVDKVCSNDQVCDLVPVLDDIKTNDANSKDHQILGFDCPRPMSYAEESINDKALEMKPEPPRMTLNEEPQKEPATQMEADQPCVSMLEHSQSLIMKNVSLGESAADHSQAVSTLDENIERNLVEKEKENGLGSSTAKEVETSSISAAQSSSSGRKRNRELERLTGNKLTCSSFIRSPCEGLRPRSNGKEVISSSRVEEVKQKKKEEKAEENGGERCDIEGCRMRFTSKGELSLHKQNRCPHEGCGKKFSSHKYAAVHSRVHLDERPLKCPWEGCSRSFKWGWARTEHIRVHTGDKPYKCKCGISFRFVSDFSRHRRKTGHNHVT